MNQFTFRLLGIIIILLIIIIFVSLIIYVCIKDDYKTDDIDFIIRKPGSPSGY